MTQNFNNNYRRRDAASFVDDPAKNPFFKGMEVIPQNPASFGRIFVKAIFLFMFALVVGFNPTVQTFALDLWASIYSNGFIMFMIAIIIYGVIMAALIGVAMRMLLSQSKVGQLSGALFFAAIQGFIISTMVACGEMFTLWGYNVAELAVFVTLAIIVISLIASNFVVFDVKKATNLYVILIITGLVSGLIWVIGMFIPGIHNFLIDLYYFSPVGIAISIAMIGFITYVTMGLFGFLRNNISKFDKQVEWYCSAVVLYLFIRLYIAITRLLMQLALRGEN